MKQINCRILSIALIIIIIIVSSFSYSVPVYASHGGGGGINHDREAWIMKDTNTINVEDDGKLMYWIEYIMSQIGVIISDHDISKAMANDQTMKSYIAKGYYDANEDTVTFPQETVTYVYNYIQNHYDEWLPFIIEKTYNMYEIPASTFRTKAAYDAFRSYCSSHHFTVALPQCSVNYMYLADATPYIKDGGAFVSYGNMVTVMNSDWNTQLLPYDYYQLKVVDGNDTVDITENRGEIQWIAHYDPNKTDFGVFRQNPFIVTPDGGRIRVFKSGTEFMNYDAGQRKVYFGSGFYDFDPTDITATWDEINEKIDRMDDILQDILDAITDNPNISEEELEKLIDELLGKIGEIGGDISSGIGETNSLLGGISSTLGGIASSLSGYFSSVLSYLSGLVGMIEEGFMTLSEKLDMMIYELGLIYESMGDMTEEEVSEKTDSLLSQLFSAFSEIGDVLKGKFPFCLPNDLYTILALLAGNEVSVSPGAGGGGGDIMICAYGAADEDSKAPVFEIPFVIGSADIEEKIIIDLSPFEYISKLSRTLMTLYYCACLMQLTLKVIDLGKDLGDD